MIPCSWQTGVFDYIKHAKLLCVIELLTSSGLPHPVTSLFGHFLAVPSEARPDYESMRQLFQKWSAQLGEGQISASGLNASCCTLKLLQTISIGAAPIIVV